MFIWFINWLWGRSCAGALAAHAAGVSAVIVVAGMWNSMRRPRLPWSGWTLHGMKKSASLEGSEHREKWMGGPYWTTFFLLN